MCREWLKTRFWVKTCHSHSYWSAKTGSEWHDNLFDFNPEETIKFMASLSEPWIAFKVLAAGAIKPEEGLNTRYNGADFICLGMYDFRL